MSALTIAHLSDIHYGPKETSAVSTMLREKGVFVEKLLPVNEIQTEESELQLFIEQYNENRKNSSR